MHNISTLSEEPEPPINDIDDTGDMDHDDTKETTIESTINSKYYKEINDDDDDDVDDDENMDMKEIKDIKKKLKMCATSLYLKYIGIGSEFEINISWNMREKYINLFQQTNDKNNNKLLDKYDFDDYIDLYDECCNDMFKLMKDSFDRFTKKNEYKKLKKFVFV